MAVILLLWLRVLEQLQCTLMTVLPLPKEEESLWGSSWLRCLLSSKYQTLDNHQICFNLRNHNNHFRCYMMCMKRWNSVHIEVLKTWWPDDINNLIHSFLYRISYSISVSHVYFWIIFLYFKKFFSGFIFGAMRRPCSTSVFWPQVKEILLRWLLTLSYWRPLLNNNAMNWEMDFS